MSGVIKIENGELVTEAANYVKELETRMQSLKKEYAEVKSALLKAMSENDVVKLETEDIRINYVGETTRETFDTKSFEDDFPDLYDDYVKITAISPSVRITIKK